MAVFRSVIISAGLTALASAYTPPTNPTYGALLLPDVDHPLTQGQQFTVKWVQPTDQPSGQTVSLVLCRGNSNNCVPDSTAIVEKVDASAQQYNWNVPCDLPTGTLKTDSGYGMLVIVDGTGVFQYSTQFSVLSNPSCGTSSSSSSSSASSTTSDSASSTSSDSGTKTTSSTESSSTDWSDWEGWTTSTTTTTKTTTTPVKPVTTSSSSAGGWEGWVTTSYTTPPGTRAPVSTYNPGPSATVKPYTGGASKVALNAAGALAVAAVIFAAL